MTSKLLKMQLIEDDEDLGKESVGAGDESHAGTPAWMRTLGASALEWLKLLPDTLTPLRRTADNIKRPLYRFFEREIWGASSILDTVKGDLISVKMICQVALKK
jgi:dynein heavy chain 1